MLSNTTPSDELLALIRLFEGLRLRAYLCPTGVPTIGYGQTGPSIKLGVVWTIEKAEIALVKFAGICVCQTIALCPTIIDDSGKITALADFVYNLGSARLAGSTLRRKVNKRQWEAASIELTKWVRAGGIKLNGLILRRELERRLFLGIIMEKSNV